MEIYFESGIALYRSRTKPTTAGLDVAGENSGHFSPPQLVQTLHKIGQNIVNAMQIHQMHLIRSETMHLIFECSFHKRARKKFFDDFSWNNPISMNLITIEKKHSFLFNGIDSFIYLF